MTSVTSYGGIPVHPRERLDESEREFRKMVIVAIDQAKRKKQD